MHILANIGAKFIRIYFILLVDIKIIVFDFTSLCLSHTRQTVPKIIYNCLFVYIILIDKLENAIVSNHLSYWPPLFLPIFSNHFPCCLGNFITPTQHIVVTDRFKTSFSHYRSSLSLHIIQSILHQALLHFSKKNTKKHCQNE